MSLYEMKSDGYKRYNASGVMRGTVAKKLLRNKGDKNGGGLTYFGEAQIAQRNATIHSYAADKNLAYLYEQEGMIRAYNGMVEAHKKTAIQKGGSVKLESLNFTTTPISMAFNENASEEDGGNKFINAIKKIFNLIKNAFKRFIQAIINLIKTVVNLIKSGSIKKHHDFYKKNVDKYTKYSSEVLKSDFAKEDKTVTNYKKGIVKIIDTAITRMTSDTASEKAGLEALRDGSFEEIVAKVNDEEMGEINLNSKFKQRLKEIDVSVRNFVTKLFNDDTLIKSDEKDGNITGYKIVDSFFLSNKEKVDVTLTKWLDIVGSFNEVLGDKGVVTFIKSMASAHKQQKALKEMIDKIEKILKKGFKDEKKAVKKDKESSRSDKRESRAELRKSLYNALGALNQQRRIRNECLIAITSHMINVDTITYRFFASCVKIIESGKYKKD